MKSRLIHLRSLILLLLVIATRASESLPSLSVDEMLLYAEELHLLARTTKDGRKLSPVAECIPQLVALQSCFETMDDSSPCQLCLSGVTDVIELFPGCKDESATDFVCDFLDSCKSVCKPCKKEVKDGAVCLVEQLQGCGEIVTC